MIYDNDYVLVAFVLACTCSFYPFSLLIYSNNKTDAPKCNVYKL